MSLKIEQDHSRFRQIVRGKVRKNLKQYITRGELLGKQGKDFVSIPIHQIEVPHIRYGDNNPGVGQGDGDVGSAVPGQDGDKDGQGKAGDQEGQHVLEVDISLEDLAEILGEELQLPRIDSRGKKELVEQKDRYVGVRRTGPNSLRHFRRSYREALRRQLAAGSYDAKRPVVIPIRDDLRFRSWKVEREPTANAAIIYMMDVSGSMGDEQKEIVRIESFWIDTWLRHNYQGIETRFIIHDATAKEVDRDTFFRTRESGGTMISSAYKLASQIIENDYPVSEWNIYPFHFSDGDNWSVDDTLLCVDILKKKLLPVSNLFCYGQVESPYGSGQFIRDLHDHFKDQEVLVTSEIKDRDGIVNSIREFLGKGL